MAYRQDGDGGDFGDGPALGEEANVGVFGEAAGRDGARRVLVTDGHHDECWTDGSRWHCHPGCSAGTELRFEPLASRRSAGDAGHVPGCARDHALDTACAGLFVSLSPEEFAKLPRIPVEDLQRALDAGRPEELRGVDVSDAAPVHVRDHRAALSEMLRRAYALDDGQVATVLRVADTLAAGVSLEAREMLGREAWAQVREADAWEMMHEEVREDYRRVGERLFAIGRASVVPPDAELGRVLASWCALTSWERGNIVSNVERIARRHWSDVAATALSPEGCASLDRVWVTLEYTHGPGVIVDGADVWKRTGPRPLTAEEWQRLRAAGVPVADGVGV